MHFLYNKIIIIYSYHKKDIAKQTDNIKITEYLQYLFTLIFLLFRLLFQQPESLILPAAYHQQHPAHLS